ncbi:AbrB/MazE/SpoVT family DNA-binding domain-containing protein [Infirmifilum lucidum]|uniref:AbrB/MazE/SpoVT family DNA-binding domain-containing protein n=1 Tax=Infirmifilum lucidum TaxID=2776706 RepID=A0A7L9FI09_9CREN|nr:AbrB/MazE/SpoVT family DNA-binding domain-containing protein [Infirmifilum lucidum]QOJ79002.1 AbrB/MazE/SpoVT family DNA-binding domain-containing protein [Infirmifilum lucidum]
MKKVRVTRKYQVTIPKEVRELVGVRVGDELKVTVEGNRIVLESLKPVVGNPVDYLSSLSPKPSDLDAVKLVEESWHED